MKIYTFQSPMADNLQGVGGEHDQVGELQQGELGPDDQQVHDLDDPGHELGLPEVTLG